MDSNLREYISHVLSDGLKFIESIGKHLPTNVVKEKNTITESFNQLIKKLNECDNSQTPDYVVHQIKDNRRGIMNDTKTKSDHEYISLQDNSVFREDSKKANDDYTQVDVSVNSEVKGMYYCLIENGALLLNRKLDSEHAEYEIPLEKYAFRAEEGFKIKFVHNQLEIKLIFSCPNECDSWLEYFFKARQSIYPQAKSNREREPPQISSGKRTLKPPYEYIIAPGSPKLPPKNSHKLQWQKKYPGVAPILARSHSAAETRDKNDFVDLSTFDLEKSKQLFQQNLQSNKSKLNVDDTTRKPIFLKQSKSMPNKSRIISPLQNNSFTAAPQSPVTWYAQ